MRNLLILTMTILAAGVAMQRSLADEEFSLVINPFTGTTSLRNDAASAVDLDGYFVTSGGAPVLDAVGWTSFQDNAFTGWTETASGADRLGELNLFGSRSVGSGESISIGNAYTPFTPSALGEVEPGLTNIDFTYSLVGEAAASVGDVEFEARNTVVLVIDTTTGAASLQNQSGFDVDLDGYLVTSNAGVLDNAGWSPLAGSDEAWTSSTGAANRLSEGNLFGSTLLAANGGTLALGNAINTSVINDENDLELDFSVAGVGSIAGGVLFAASAPSADFDNDGDVDGNDLTDPVDGWQVRYGNDLSGSDFLNWQRQFGSSESVSAITAVPEPSTALLAVASLVVALTARRSR